MKTKKTDCRVTPPARYHLLADILFVIIKFRLHCSSRQQTASVLTSDSSLPTLLVVPFPIPNSLDTFRKPGDCRPSDNPLASIGYWTLRLPNRHQLLVSKASCGVFSERSKRVAVAHSTFLESSFVLLIPNPESSYALGVFGLEPKFQVFRP